MSAPLVLAMDVSKVRTGIAAARIGELPLFTSIGNPDDDGAAAVVRLGRWFIDRTSVDNFDWVYAEASISLGAFMGRYNPDKGKVEMTSSPDTIVKIAKMMGVIEFLASMRSIPFRTAHVSTVRKAFLGHGDLPRKEAKRRARELCRLLGWNPSNDDEGDAGAVFYFAGTIVAPKVCALVTPMQQAKVANTIGGIDIGAFIAPKAKARRR